MHSQAVAPRGRFLAFVLLFACLAAPAARAASFPPASGTGGGVATAYQDATDAGLEMLRAGGTAVDAAVATALALAVVQPQAGNLGGGGFAVVRMDGELASLDFREVAPARAHREMFLDEDGTPIPDASTIGPLAAGVPGTPLGLWELHRRFGELPWARVVEPARQLAAEGFAVTRALHEALLGKQEKLARFPETARVWLPDGRPPAPGDVLVLPELAATLADYAAEGPTAITDGARAAAVERISDKYGGVLQAGDLADYRPVWREPLRFEAFGWSVASMDLPGTGGIILGQALKLLESFDWASLPRFGADRAHLLSEILRRSFADRYLMGDPGATEVTAEQLLAPSWLAVRRGGLDTRRATPSSTVAQWEPGAVRPKESLQTTHLSVADSAGNLVSLTTTLNGSFGSGLLVPGAGYILNNQMDDFTANPGRPNLYGLVQGEANTVAPGKRMLSSMSPTILWRGAEAVALGGRGGSRIPTAVLQVLLSLLGDGDTLQAAVNRPRIHHQWLPDQIEIELDALSPETQEALRQRGHTVVVDPTTAKVHAVRLLPDGSVEAAADPREPGTAGVVFERP